METGEPRAAYIHVPFCRHRCGYCDFPLVANRDDLIDGYLNALNIELSNLDEPREVDTLFFGGGTPTHLPPSTLQQLMSLVRKWFPLADDYEFSVETNPSDLDDERIAVLRAAGVNRVSLGVQSLDRRALEVLERDHSAADVMATIDRLGERGLDNLSLDLIFAVPGQSQDDWQRTLSSIVELPFIKHVSTYGLTYEKGTSFWRRRAGGELRVTGEETERQMYAAAMDVLPANGFEHYEISNFAKPGYECRHNQVYWRGESYFAFGPGAASYLDGTRSQNHRSVTTWLKRVLAGESGVAETETLDAEARARELIMLGLRMTAGIDIALFADQTGFDLRQLCGPKLDLFMNDGLLEQVDSHLRLTREGHFLADTVTSEFL